MSYRNPDIFKYALVITIFVAVLVIIWRLFKSYKKLGKKQQKDMLGYGAMWMVKDLRGYKLRKIKYYILCACACAGIVLSLVGTAQLMARPSYTEEITTGVRRRDIFLCLDVSYSLYGLNADFVENLETVVKGLDGDRIGISIFNTSTVLYMPMTEDKDFAIEKLEELKEYFEKQKIVEEEYYGHYISDFTDEEYNDYLELSAWLDSFEAGTLLNNSERGSSLIGEGLASCLYNFPSLDDDERTRVIIMVTDNAQNAFSTPTVELAEAAQLCAQNDVTVFGIFPPKEEFDLLSADYDYEQLKGEMEAAVTGTGGGFYVAGSDFDTSHIIASIQEHEAMQVDEITMTREIDMPREPFIICFVGLLLVALAKGGGI